MATESVPHWQLYWPIVCEFRNVTPATVYFRNFAPMFVASIIDGYGREVRRQTLWPQMPDGSPRRIPPYHSIFDQDALDLQGLAPGSYVVRVRTAAPRRATQDAPLNLEAPDLRITLL